jgi:hypothetical protein
MSHVLDLESAASRLTGTVTCVNDLIKELKKCQLCKEHILSLIRKATGLLDNKEEILTAQLKSLQQFRGKRKEPLFEDDEARKRARLEAEREFDEELGLS